jgi:GntR family transcriptional repressor for pyruvate dehydrogenase complex
VQLGRSRQAPGNDAGKTTSRVARAIRTQIVDGHLQEGCELGTTAHLTKRFGVSQPCLREALRILEAEGLVTIRRGGPGGVVVNQLDERILAKRMATVMAARTVLLSDVRDALHELEPIAARSIATMRGRKASVTQLREKIVALEHRHDDLRGFQVAKVAFSAQLVALSPNHTLSLVASALAAVTASGVAAGRTTGLVESRAVRAWDIRAHRQLVDLIESGDGLAAERYWRTHIDAPPRRISPANGTDVVDMRDYE